MIDEINTYTGGIPVKYIDLGNIEVDGKDSFAVMGPVWIKVDYRDFLKKKSIGVDTYKMTSQYINPERNTDYIPETYIIDDIYLYNDATWKDCEVKEKYSWYYCGVPAYINSIKWAEGSLLKTYNRYP